MSIQDRIAALNLGHVGRAPGDQPAPAARRTAAAPGAATSKPPPPPPPALPRSGSYNGHTLHLQGEDHASTIGNQPMGEPTPAPQGHTPARTQTLPVLPPRRPSSQAATTPPPPSLPPRKASVPILERRPSQESVSSTVSAGSSSALSTLTAATSDSRRPSCESRSSAFRVPAYDPSSLPPLPPKAEKKPNRPGVSPRPSASSLQAVAKEANDRPLPPPRATPPPLPTRVDERANKYVYTEPQAVPAVNEPAVVPPVEAAEPPPVEPARPKPRMSARAWSAYTESQAVPAVNEPTVVPPVEAQEPTPVEPARPKPRTSALAWGLNNSTNKAPTIPQRPVKTPAPEPANGLATDVPQRPASNPQPASEPPPIPLSSRPNLAQLQASKPKVSAPTVSQSVQKSCLLCRDFSGPDTHAARFPREAIPLTDLGWLSNQLTSPFPSPTDKARAIFTWLHHNINYDTQAFFSGNLKSSTPASTMASGFAVCEGYAGLFTALAAAAGLESIVIGGHGKGFGHVPLAAGAPIPPFESNHAWNAVKIDNGEWKLVDACWGAGHICHTQLYKREFHPGYFTMDNDEFGERHFSQDRSLAFRSDGRQASWDEYIVGPAGGGDRVKIFSGCASEHGLAESSFAPQGRDVRVRGAPAGARLHFQFSTVCAHWDNERMGKGKPYVFVLNVGGRDGRKRENVAFRSSGRHWYLDLPAADVGAAGQKVQVCAITSVAGQDARGWSVEAFNKANGKKSMAWSYVAEWQLV